MKNKEIKELLNKMKNCNGVFDYYLEYGEVDLLLSYIEQLEEELKEELEENYKQSEWLVKKQKKIEQLENNRDKAIEMLTYKQNAFSTCFSVCDVIDKLKGDRK